MQIEEGTYRSKKMKEKLITTRDYWRADPSRSPMHANEPEKQASEEQNKANNTTVSERETSEKPIDQAQIHPEA